MPTSLPNLGEWDDNGVWDDSQLWADYPARGSWKGDPNNPVPNSVRENINRSDKPIGENRAQQIRRDNDTQKNFHVSLYDIDETILNHLSHLELQVEDAGKLIKVPTFYGSPEKWTSAQRDGYLRDNQGKILLPALVFKRTTTDPDATLQFFNRYLNVSAIKTYSSKNKYTQFSVLNGSNAPVGEVFNVVIPSHVLLTYHFIIWTEYVEQMNKLVATMQFNTKDYWGTKTGFKFRTRIESFSHTTEVVTDEDRNVKSEFDLTVHAYILPDQIVKLDSIDTTTKKLFTPKKIIIGAEVVSTGFDLNKFNNNGEKWRNPNYPNLPKDAVIPKPGVTWSGDISIGLLSTLRSTITVSNGVPSSPSNAAIKWGPAPGLPTTPGTEGEVSYDSQYLYLYTNGLWKRLPLNLFS